MTDVLISSDSHVDEPLELWSERLPRALRERAPRREHRPDGTYMVVEGIRPRRLSGPGEERVSEAEHARRPGGADPAARICDLDEDGIAGEVLYPTIGLFIHNIPDGALQQACARVYNDWLAEVFSQSSKRFAGVGLVSVVDLPAAEAEIERIHGLGLRGAMLPINPPATRPYNSPEYDPVWARAAALGLPISFHVGTGTDPVFERGPGGACINYVMVGLGAQKTMTYLAASGVFERHPDLHCIMVECGAGWLAWTMYMMDEAFSEHARWVHPKLRMKPGDYVRRQGHVTFGNDPAGISNLHLTGPDAILWATDYPHPEGTWPHSRAVVARLFAEVPADARRSIVGGTTARLYRFDA